MRAAKAGRIATARIAEIIHVRAGARIRAGVREMDELVNALIKIYRQASPAPAMSSYMEAFPVTLASESRRRPPMTGMHGVQLADPRGRWDHRA